MQRVGRETSRRIVYEDVDLHIHAGEARINPYPDGHFCRHASRNLVTVADSVGFANTAAALIAVGCAQSLQYRPRRPTGVRLISSNGFICTPIIRYRSPEGAPVLFVNCRSGAILQTPPGTACPHAAQSLVVDTHDTNLLVGNNLRVSTGRETT